MKIEFIKELTTKTDGLKADIEKRIIQSAMNNSNRVTIDMTEWSPQVKEEVNDWLLENGYEVYFSSHISGPWVDFLLSNYKYLLIKW